MKILITGGNGFVGKHLIPLLRDQGHNCIFFTGDIRNIGEIAKLKTIKADIVIHLAAQVNGKDSRLFHEVNAKGTQNLLEVCREINPRCFMLLSSIRVLSSDQNAYSLSKKAAEEAVIKSGMPYIILRPSLLYGRGDKKNLNPFFVLIARLPVIPILDFKIQPLFIGDLVKIICHCLELKTNQIINLTGEETVNLYDLLQSARVLLNRHSYILRLPKHLTPFFKIISRCRYFPFPWWRIQPLLANEIFPGDSWPDMFKIKPIKLIDGLKQTLE